MNVLFLTRKYPPSIGGMETYSKELHEHMRQLGATVELYKPDPPIIGRPPPHRMATYLFGACVLLLKRARHYDSILLGDYAISSLAIVAKLASLGRARTVVSLHGNDIYFMRKRTWIAALYRTMSWIVLRSHSLDAAIANSQAVRREAEKWGLRDAAVVALGCTTPQENSTPTDERESKILFSGRLIRYKGLSWFAREVWPWIDESCELWVVGPVWDQRELDVISSHPRIRYLGVVDPAEARRLQGLVSATIMPNLPPQDIEQDEGFGLVALESAAAGTPVVASRCGGIPDAVTEDITGFLLTPLDAAAWVKKINEILEWDSNKRAVFAKQAKLHVASHFSWQLTAERTLAILDRKQHLHS